MSFSTFFSTFFDFLFNCLCLRQRIPNDTATLFFHKHPLLLPLSHLIALNSFADFGHSKSFTLEAITFIIVRSSPLYCKHWSLRNSAPPLHFLNCSWPSQL